MDKAAKWSAVQGLFDQLVDLPPSEQGRLIDRSNAPPEVIAEVRAMLIADRAAGVLDRGSPFLTGSRNQPAILHR